MDFTNRQKTNTSMPAILLLLMLNVTASVYDMKRFKKELEESIAESRDFVQRIQQVEFNAFQLNSLNEKSTYEAFKFCSDVCKSGEPLESHTLIEIRRKHHRDIAENARLVDVISCLHKAVSQNDTNEVFTVDTQLAVYNIKNNMLKSFLILSDEVKMKTDIRCEFLEAYNVHCVCVMDETLRDMFSGLIFNVTLEYTDEMLERRRQKNANSDESQQKSECEVVYSRILEPLRSNNFLHQCTAAFMEAYNANTEMFIDMFYEGIKRSECFKRNKKYTQVRKNDILKELMQRIFEFNCNRSIRLSIAALYELIRLQRHSGLSSFYVENIKSFFGCYRRYRIDSVYNYTAAFEGYRQAFRISTDKFFKDMGIFSLVRGEFGGHAFVRSTSYMLFPNSSIRILCNQVVTTDNLRKISMILNKMEGIFEGRTNKIIYINLRKAVSLSGFLGAYNITFPLRTNPGMQAKRKLCIGASKFVKLLVKEKNEKHLSCYNLDTYICIQIQTNGEEYNRSYASKIVCSGNLPKATHIAIDSNYKMKMSCIDSADTLAAFNEMIYSNYVISFKKDAAVYTVDIYPRSKINKNLMSDATLVSQYSIVFEDLILVIENDKESYKRLNRNITQPQLLSDLGFYLRTLQLFSNPIPFPIIHPDNTKNYYYDDIGLYNLNKLICVVNISIPNTLQAVNNKFLQYQRSTIGSQITFSLNMSSKYILCRHKDHHEWAELTESFIASTGIKIDRLEELLDRCCFDEKRLNTSKGYEIRLAMLQEYQLIVYAIPQNDNSTLVYVLRDDFENKLNNSSANFTYHMHNKCLENYSISAMVSDFDLKFHTAQTGINSLTLIFITFVNLEFDMLADIKTQFETQKFDFYILFLRLLNQKQILESDVIEIMESSPDLEFLLEQIIVQISVCVGEYARLLNDTKETRIIITSFDGLNCVNMDTIDKLRNHLIKTII